MTTRQPTQGPIGSERAGRPKRGAHLERGQVARLLAAWLILAAGLFLLRGQIEDPFWRGLFVPAAFGAVVIAAAVTLWIALPWRTWERRRRERRRGRDRRAG